MADLLARLVPAHHDVVLMIVLGVCVGVVQHLSREMRSVAAYLGALVVGAGAWIWLGMPFLVQLIQGGVDRTALNPLKLIVVVGVAIWTVVRASDGAAGAVGAARAAGAADARVPRAPGGPPVVPKLLTTVDGVTVGVGDDVWSQNHWPWTITAIGADWVHFRHEADDGEQTGMIAVQDFDRYYYRQHPTSPMSCRTAGCGDRPWGAG